MTRYDSEGMPWGNYADARADVLRVTINTAAALRMVRTPTHIEIWVGQTQLVNWEVIR